MTAFLMFLAFLVGTVVGAEFSRKLRARLAAELEDAREREEDAIDRANDAEGAMLLMSRQRDDAQSALANRIARDSLRGQRAAATRKAMREARLMANERSDAAFDGDGDTVGFPSPFDEGGSVTFVGPGDLGIVSSTPPAQEAA